jgi:CDP-glycerol glycerophosphotransferase (TagB/SpsB family)
MMAVQGRLLVEGFFDDADSGDVMALRAGAKTIPLPGAGHYAELSYFGKTIVSYRTFEADIDMDALSEGDEIYFIPAGDAQNRLRMVFAEPEAGVSPALGCLYRNFGAFAIEYDPAANALTVRRPPISLRLKNESRAFRRLLRAKAPLLKKLSALALRAAYFITRPYFKNQKLRLYYDRIYMGGEDGQYLFEYSSDRCRAEGGPVARRRYIASNLSGAYRDLKRRDYKVHAGESPYRKLLALQAEIIVATRADVKGAIGFSPFEKRWFADLFSAHIVCMQHGSTTRCAPQRYARYVDNTELYFCASEEEAANLGQSLYGYKPGMLKVTGLPRFDERVSYPESIILFAPAWDAPSAAGAAPPPSVGTYAPGFRDTACFDVYSELISDEALRSLLLERGYLLVFLLPPEISAQAPDFDEYAGGAVEIVSSLRKGYSQYLNQAAVLITDYDDVHIDFAYMEKPVVYYHPDGLPRAQGDIFDYADKGFGPVANDIPGLIAILSGLLTEDAGGEEREKYAERERTFFTYNDRENRGRIYDEIEREFGKQDDTA